MAQTTVTKLRTALGNYPYTAKLKKRRAQGGWHRA